MTKTTRRKIDAALQAKSASEAVLEPATAADLVPRYKVPPTQVYARKQQLR